MSTAFIAALLAMQTAGSPIPLDEARACVNLGNALDAPSEGEWGYRIEDAHIAEIAAAGFEVVRLPVRWSAHARKKAPYTIDQDMVDRVRHVIDTATAQGLGVVVDLHHYEEAVANPKKHHKRILGLWTQIAAKYADLPQSVAFEVFNEPNGAFTEKRIAALNEDVLAIIRQTNPNRQVVLGNAPWNALGSLEGFELPTGDDLSATFHFYEPFTFTHQGAPWVDDTPPTGRRLDPDKDAEVLIDAARAMAKAKKELGVPVLLGEFGAYRPETLPQDRMAYMQIVRTIAQSAGITWCVWNFSSDFAIYDVEAGRFLPGALEALGLADRPTE